jgi:glutamate transport system substrate-binding protein
VRTPRLIGLITVGVLTVALAGCTGEADPNLAEVGPADFPAHSTMQRIAATETVRIGVTGNDLDDDDVPRGFEAELGRMVAGALGIPAHAVSWVRTEPTEHERLVEDGFVDVIIAGFAIDERSLQIVDFAGPYHVGGQALLVRSDTADDGSGTVCTTADVAPTLALPDTDVQVGGYADCLSLLRSGDIDAVSAADLTAAGEVDEQLSVSAQRLTEEAYGIALPKGDDAFRGFLNDVLQAAVADGRWATAWSSTAEPVLGPASPPAVDRYE